MAQEQSPTSPDRDRGVSGGVAVITGAKVWFVIAGYALYFGLTRLLGPELFGLYAVAISIVSVINNVLIAACLQTVSRFVAKDEGFSGSVLRAALWIQLGIGVSIFLLFQLLSPAIAGWFRDPQLILPLRISSGIAFAYALYAANVGFLNGRRRFVKQAALDATFSTMKTGLILSAVALGLGVAGAVAGFASAALLILMFSFVVVSREPKSTGEFNTADLLHFGGWLVLLTLAANFVLSADLWVVKRLADPDVANTQSGLYRASLTLSQLLFQLMIPLTLVVFPNFARLKEQTDQTEARNILRGGFRYLSLVLIPGAAVLALVGEDLIVVLYGESYRSGGAWLAYLAPAYGFFTGAYLLAMALSGAGRPRAGVAILGVTLLGQVSMATLWYPVLGPGGAALGDLIGMGVGFTIGLIIVTRIFGSVFPVSGLVRGILIAVILSLGAAMWPAGGRMLLVKLAVLGAVGLAILFLMKEIQIPVRLWRRGR